MDFKFNFFTKEIWNRHPESFKHKHQYYINVYKNVYIYVYIFINNSKRFLQVDETMMNSLTSESEKIQQAQMLISARWTITFTFFEKELGQALNGFPPTAKDSL